MESKKNKLCVSIPPKERLRGPTRSWSTFRVTGNLQRGGRCKEKKNTKARRMGATLFFARKGRRVSPWKRPGEFQKGTPRNMRIVLAPY